MVSPAPDSAVLICNRALEMCEHYGFLSFEDGTPEAERAKLHYDITRREVLEAIDWNFARGYAALDLLADAGGDPARPYLFSVPPDCLRVRRVTDPERVDWERVGNRVAAECDALSVAYTRDVTNAAEFPSSFSGALSLLLAARFSPKYGRSANRVNELMAHYQGALEAALLTDAREQDDQAAFEHSEGWDVSRDLMRPAGSFDWVFDYRRGR